MGHDWAWIRAGMFVSLLIVVVFWLLVALAVMYVT